MDVGAAGEPASRTGPSRWLPTVAVVTVAAVFSRVVFGSRVRASGSGMGSPNWPLCDGRIGPIMQFHALMEQLHR